MFGLVLYGNNETLPVGQYRIEVNMGAALDENKKRWHWNEETVENDRYSIVEYVRFPIANHFCEMDIIPCDPISVEESLFTQFPDRYMHLVKGARTIENKSEDSKKKKVNHGFDRLASMLTKSKDVAELTHGLFFADSGTKLTFALGKLLQNTMSPKETKLGDSMNLTFSTIDTWEKVWKLKEAGSKLLKYASGEKQIDTIKEALRNSYWGRGFFRAEDQLENFERTITSRLGRKIFEFKVPEASQNILVPFTRLMKPVEIAAKASAIKHGVDDYSGADDTLGVSVRNYQEMIRDYYDKTFFIDQDFESETGENGGTFFSGQEKRTIFYDSDEYGVKEEYQKEVADAAAYLVKNRKDNTKIIVINGYTDSTASVVHNLELSFNRSRGVKKAILQELELRKKREEGLDVNQLAKRILTMGHCEKYAENDVDNEAMKAENRRCDIFYGTGKWTHGGCREGIRNLEKQRSLTVGNWLKLKAEEKKLMLAVFDAVLCVAAITPVTSGASLVLVALKDLAKSGMKLYRNAYSVVDHWMFDGLLEREDELKKELRSFTGKSYANYTLLQQEKKEDLKKERDHDFIPSVDLMDTNFRIRAEVITGLFNLLYRAQLSAYETHGPGHPEKVKEKMKQYKIREYIRTFILNDGWSFPLENWGKVALDEYWLLAVNSKGIEQDEAGDLQYHHRENFYLEADFLLVGAGKAEKRENDSHNNLVYRFDGVPRIPFSYSICRDLNQIDHVKTEFQKNFPIHSLDSENIETLSDLFSPTKAGEFDENIYAYMNLHYRRRDEKKKSDWKPFSQRFIGDGEFRKFEPLSPYDQVRIIVVLKKEIQTFCTASIQLHRGDENAKGVKYKTMMRPLSADLLIGDEEKAFEGCMGCVFEPFFQLGGQTVQGLKPMASWWLSLPLMSPECYEACGGLKDIPYYITVRVAHSPATEHVVYFPKSAAHFKQLEAKKEEEKAEFLLTVDPDRVHRIDEENLSSVEKKLFAKRYKKRHWQYLVKDEGVFLSEDFLKSLTSSDEYPPLMEDDIQATVLIKAGNGNFVNAHPVFKTLGWRAIREGHYTLTFHRFDWSTPVEFIVVASCGEISEESKRQYEERGLDWRNIPVTMTLFYDGIRNIPGPTYSAPEKLQYLGEAELDWNQNIAFTRGDQKGRNKNNPLNEIISWFESKERENLAGALLEWLFSAPNGEYYLDKRKTKEKRHVFAAHFVMNYTSIGGESINGLRPFGRKLKKDDYYEYFIKVTSKGKSGLNQELCKKDSSIKDLVNRSVYTFKFSAPSEYEYRSEDAPWNRECKNEDSKIAPEERIGLEEWITDYATVTKPVRRAGAVKAPSGG